MFKRYTLPGRHLRPAGHPLAEGDRGARRGARPVPPLDRHRPDDPRLLRRRDARRWSTASSSRRWPASRCATRSTTPTRRPQKETQYYEMFGQRGIWHKGWKAVTEHGPMTSAWATSRRTRWQLFHTDEDRAEAHDLAEQHPEKVEGARRRSGSRRPRRTTCCRSTTWRSPARTSRRSSRWSSRSRCRRAASTPTTRAPPRSRSASPPTSTACRTRSWPRSSSPATREGVIFAARLALRRPLAVRQGRQARLRLQLPRHPAGEADHRAGAARRARTSSAWSSPRSAWVSTTSPTVR